MALEGIVVNGVIVLDSGGRLPEGARVRVEVAEADALVPPPEPSDRAQELAILRASLDDVQAGRGVPFAEFMAQLAAEYQLPPAPPE